MRWTAMQSMNAEASSHGKLKRLHWKDLVLSLLAALAVAFLFSPPLQAQGGPEDGYVDLVMNYEYDTSRVAYSVRNNGTATATGVTVSFHIKDLQISIGDVPPEITDKRTDNATKEQWFTWEVGTILPGDTSAQLIFSTQLHPGHTTPGHIGVITATAKSNQPEPGFLLANNEIKVYSFDESGAGATLHMDGSNLALLLSVDDLRPDAGDDVNFDLTASNENEFSPDSLYSNLIGDVKIKVELSDGLEFKGTWNPSDVVKSGSQSATWSPPDTATYTASNIFPDSQKIDIETQLTSATLTDIPLEERCITARVEDSLPPPSPDYVPGSLTQCLGDDPTVLFDEYRVDLFTLEATAQNDLVLLTQVNTLLNSELRSRSIGLGDPDLKLSPEKFIIQVNPLARGFVRDNGVTSMTWQTKGGDAITGVEIWENVAALGVSNTTASTVWTGAKDKLTASGIGTAGKPGTVRIFNTGGNFKIADADNTGFSTAYDFGGRNGIQTTTVVLHFGELGTYKVGRAYKGTHSGVERTTAEEMYTFHVGPVAELGVVAVRQTSGGLEIAAVNNGPDRSLGARVVLETGQICDFGVFRHRDEYLPATRTCVFPNVVLTPEQLAGDERIGYIENHVKYTVCIDSNGNDVLPKPANRNACGGSWHTADVYDYDDSNNDIYLSQDPAPTLNLQRAQARAVPILVLRWERLDELFGSPVSFYQVERLDTAEWELLGNVRPPAAGEDPEYQDADEDRAQTPRYRVRAVNGEGLAGPWSEHGSAQPGVVLHLDKTSIKEPEDPANVTEDSIATVTATLTGQVSSQDVTVAMSVEPASGSNLDGAPAFTVSENKMLTIPAGSREATSDVTITALEDDDSQGERVSITAVAANARCTTCSLTLTIEDDDAPGLKLSAETVDVDEGLTATYTVALNAEPSADVTVRLTSDNGDVTVPAELTFTPTGPDAWDQPQTVTVRAADDFDAVDDTATITHRASGAVEYRGIRASLDVTVTDDGIPGVTVSAPADGISVTEGLGGKTYTVSLGTQPAGSVYITAASDNPDVRVIPATIVLNSSNWRAGRTVTVSAVHDQDGAPDRATITHEIDAQRTTAGEYDGEGVASVTVTVSDDDAPGVRVSPETLRIAEGRSGGYNVRLNTAPTADVTITVDSDNRDVTTQPASLTFTPDDWSRTQRVTVNADTDADAADDTAMLSHRMTSGDGAYNTGLSNVTVTVTVNDSDRPGVTIGPLSPTPVSEAGRLVEDTEGEGDTRVSHGTRRIEEGQPGFEDEQHPSFYTVRLDTKPTGDVMIGVKSDNPDKVAVHPELLTFKLGELTRTVMIIGKDDTDKDDEKATITHTVIAADSADEYDTVTIPSLDVIVDDNDDPGVTLIVSKPPDGSEPLEVSKGDDVRKTATYQVVLDSQADGVIVVTVESSDPKKVSVAPSVLYFSGIQIDHGRTWPDWDEPQTVTVRALDDAAAGDTVTLIHKIADANAHGWDVPIGAEVGRLTVTVRE